MTIMQATSAAAILCPPLDDEDDFDSYNEDPGPESTITDPLFKDVPATQRHCYGTDVTNQSDGNAKTKKSAMSQPLQEKFKALVEIQNKSKRARIDGNGVVDDLEAQSASLAVETAISIHQEVAQWKARIAELEALLNDSTQPKVGDQVPFLMRGDSRSAIGQHHWEALRGGAPHVARRVVLPSNRHEESHKMERNHHNHHGILFPALPIVISTVQDEASDQEDDNTM